MMIRPESHYSSLTNERPTIEVEVAEDALGVMLTIEPTVGETFDDLSLWRQLTPTEARELAVMLNHHADECDRYRERAR